MTKQDNIALKVDHVAKMFRLPTEQASGIKQAVINWTKGIKGYKEQHVLRDISFEVEKGDFFGIVGRNGSGKSTLLKLISGIYVPDEGNITVNGKLVPFIELGVGFNPELLVERMCTLMVLYWGSLVKRLMECTMISSNSLS